MPYHYQPPELEWKKLRRATVTDFDFSPVTSISTEKFKTVFEAMMTWPQGFKPLRKVERKFCRIKSGYLRPNRKWIGPQGELAYGSLTLEGKDVRMSGQDVRRGTFSHRHAVLRDEQTDKPIAVCREYPVRLVSSEYTTHCLVNTACWDLNMGMHWQNPNALVIWEAQFGDFANGAQTMIDQFIAAGEQKWNRMNGITMLLPHGYEGQGPEHSSARLERFLQLCAEFNMVVTDITTAANFFHALRRQLAWPFRKP